MLKGIFTSAALSNLSSRASGGGHISELTQWEMFLHPTRGLFYFPVSCACCHCLLLKISVATIQGAKQGSLWAVVAGISRYGSIRCIKRLFVLLSETSIPASFSPDPSTSRRSHLETDWKTPTLSAKCQSRVSVADSRDGGIGTSCSGSTEGDGQHEISGSQRL